MATIVKAYYGFSAIGNNTEDSYDNLLLKLPLLPGLNEDKKKQVRTILESIDKFRVSASVDDLATNNRLICEGPLKIRYAQKILQQLKDQINTRDCHFYACNMDDFSPVGMRNTWRILSNKQFDYDEETFLKGAIKALKHLNPVTPLLNIPNNLLSIIALEHKLKNSNVNFMGENASSQAIYSAINRVSCARLKEVFVLSSMYLHFNFVNYLLYFQHIQQLDRLTHSPVSEYAGGIIFQHVNKIKKDQIEVIFNLSLPSITPKDSFELDLPKFADTITKTISIIKSSLLEQNIKLKDIDLILVQSVHQTLIKKLRNSNTPVLDITPFTGYNLCSSAMALSHYACEFLNRDSNTNNILVIEHDIQGSLWAAVFKKHQG
ncbi:MAG: hypothetical protein KC646_16045 [Candidatus Cloacimonetes bacterium]|nr:hypothetical protein [Candidatus Cloacimonadota bacterium]